MLCWLATNTVPTRGLLIKRTLSMSKQYRMSWEDCYLAAVQHSNCSRGCWYVSNTPRLRAGLEVRGNTNIWIPNGISRHHGSRFTTTFGNLAPRNTTRWGKKVSLRRSGGVDRGNLCWLVGGETGLCDPRYIYIGFGTGWASDLNEYVRNGSLNTWIAK